LDPVVRVTLAGTGDALVSAVPSVALAVLTADCASVALGSREGVFGAVHAGWRGLTNGVVQAAVGAMRDLGATDVVGALGPCIHAGCYEFSRSDLAQACTVLGERARGATSDGRPALDIPAAVSAALTACGVDEVPGVGVCTACDGRYFSHRGRGDLGRQALLVWSAPSREETSAPVGR
jgi:copper oxidase (laccase) domain-containing protein